MFALLPLVLLLALASHIAARQERTDWMRSTLIAAVLVCAWAAMGAELLSLARWLTPVGVGLWWGGPVAVAVVLLVFRRPQFRDAIPNAPGMPEKAMAVACAALLLITGLIAALTPPTTHDCLSYHLPRQVFWIQQQSVAHFPTWDPRQMELAPLSEFLGVQLMLLSGSDGPVNMVQWWAYFASAIAAAACAREIGASMRGQWLAGLLTLSNPMAAIQSLNPKNDVLCAMFALIAVYAAVRIVRRPRGGWIDRSLLAFSLGLMILTKGTGYLIAAPIVALVAVQMLRTLGWRAVFAGAVMAIMASSFNAGHWWRNFQTFGSPIARSAEQNGFKLKNKIWTPCAVASNLIRNAALHTGMPWQSVNVAQQAAVERLHNWIGLSVDDPATTSLPMPRFEVQNRWNEDSGASAPIHLFLVCGLAVWFLTRPRLWGSLLGCTVWIGLASGLLFCLVLMWQPWNSRLHVPFFAILMPSTATWMIGWSMSGVRKIIAASAAALAIAASAQSDTKPLFGPDSIVSKSRAEIMHYFQPALREPLRELVESLATERPTSVGLVLPPHSCEYVVMRAILDGVEPAPRFVNLKYTPCPRPSVDEPAPDVVCLLSGNKAYSQIHVPSGTRYDTMRTFGLLRLQMPTVRTGESRAEGDVPSFVGWHDEVGLGRLEGPYEQWKLPVVRWGRAPAVVLRFNASNEAFVLLMECRRNDAIDQIMTVRLNGSVITTHEFGPDWAWVPFRLPLYAERGENELKIEFSTANSPDDSKAMLFRTLQIVPASMLSPPGTPSTQTP